MQKGGIIINCPNCKEAFSYNIKETHSFTRFKGISLIATKEKVQLLILCFLQLLVLYFDFFGSKPKREEVEDNQFLRVLNHVHLLTVFILLFAAGYNLLED
jgi:hypothetical protein